ELGAGDAFSARFAYGLVNGESPRDCAAHGMVDASRALAVVGAVAPRTEENTQ
ncbi:MAG: pfkB family carbohydrate kinase, partial [Actinomycetota bacterium]